jgi:hypothetical protein
VLWTGLVWLRIGIMESSCECGNKSVGSIKCWELSSGYTTGGLSSSAQHHRLSLVSMSLV